MWEALEKQYREDEVVTIISEWQFLHSIKFEAYGDIFAYGDAISTAKARLAEAGCIVPSEVIFYIFLAGIDEQTDPKWTRFIHTTVRKHKDAAEKPLINQLTHLAREYVNLPNPSIAQSVPVQPSQALAALKGKGRGKGYGRSDNRQTCPHCRKRGHREEQCWQKHPELRPKRKENSESSEQADAKKKKVVVVRKALKVRRSDTCWYMDSGAYAHICKDRELFHTYEPCSDTVSIADGVEHSCLGSGSIEFCLPEGTFLRVTNVRHIPTFDCNLLSLGAMEEKGAKIVLKDARCTVYMDGEILCQGVRTGHMYIASVRAIPQEKPVFYARSEVPEVDLWHRRLGHIGMNPLKKLLSQLEVKGVDWTQGKPIGDSEKCEICLKAR